MTHAAYSCMEMLVEWCTKYVFECMSRNSAFALLFISFDQTLQSKKVPFEIGHKILKSKVLVIIYRVIIVDKMNSSITTEEAKATDIEELLKTLSTSKEGLSTSEAFLDYIRTAAVKRGSGILAGVQSGQCY